MATRSATQRVVASLEPGSSARCATSAKITRSAAAPSSQRPAATSRIARPIYSRSHSWPSTHAPPSRREPGASTSAVAAAATACSGSRNRSIDATSRASASRPALVRAAEVVDHLGDRAAGARVPLVVRQLQVGHHAAVLVDPPGLTQVHAYKPSHRSSPKRATQFRGSGTPDVPDQGKRS